MPAQPSSNQGKDGAMLVIPLLGGDHHLLGTMLEQSVDLWAGLRSRQSGAKGLHFFFHHQMSLNVHTEDGREIPGDLQDILIQTIVGCPAVYSAHRQL